MQPAKPNAPHSSLTNRIHIDRLTSKRNRKTRYHGPGPLATLFQGPKLCRRFVRSSVVLSVLSVQHHLFLFFLAHQIRPKTSTQRHNQHLAGYPRLNLSTPRSPVAHTHTHRTGAERGRAKATNWSTTSADIIDAATGHCGGPSGFPREHAAARIFETSLAPGASTGITVSPYPRPGGWRRPNEHRRLRHAIAQPPSPRQSTPRRD